MINQLILKNLVLVDSCSLELQPQFTALTGETGAGKTALIAAIDLTLGARADSSMIRKGEDKAYVEATFTITIPTQQILDEAGIPYDPQEDLLIRRELTREGKNRIFVNGHLTPLPVLQKIGATLLELVGQHAYHTLTTSESQRAIVDRFGQHELLLHEFQAAYTAEKECKERLNTLLDQENDREKTEDRLRYQIEEIASANFKSGEEEEIVEEHRRLAHSQEILEKLTPILQGLAHHLPFLSRSHKSCESLLRYDPHLNSPTTLLHEASITVAEALNELQSYTENIDKNPQRFLYLEERLSTIDSLKRKYGRTIDEIEHFYQKAREKLNDFDNLTDHIETLRSEIAACEKTTHQLATALTENRQKTADSLSTLLTETLQSLNMQGAEVRIAVEAAPRSQWGNDTVLFWMRANVGEQPTLVKDHSSGGELSRLLFAIKTTLSEKNQTPTLIFDEIDANVGGKTATVIGEQLKTLGKHRQVICITHFPQVAAQANHHLTVQKQQREGRTITTIQPLSKEEREKELLRMLGGEKSQLFSCD